MEFKWKENSEFFSIERVIFSIERVIPLKECASMMKTCYEKAYGEKMV